MGEDMKMFLKFWVLIIIIIIGVHIVLAINRFTTFVEEHQKFHMEESHNEATQR